MIKVHMVSETQWVTQGQGVHTAFVELVQLLGTDARVQVVTNNDGGGEVFHSHTYGPYYFWNGWHYVFDQQKVKDQLIDLYQRILRVSAPGP
jgi:1,2-diacylglycerol-3-alpha-glucose alpha-1,2-galactosyltransferase